MEGRRGGAVASRPARARCSAARRSITRVAGPARGARLALVAAALAAPGCGGGGERRVVQLERIRPAADPDCGAPADARTLVVTALGDFPATEGTARALEVGDDGPALEVDGFPTATTTLAVEVRGAGGAVRAVGRTGPFALDELDDGAALPLFMAPLDGFCPTGPPASARDAPLVARVGAAVLIAGGADQDGAPVDQVERYDPTTGQFSGLGARLYGADLDAGLAGASMTALADGRVVVAGGAATAYQVYDPSAGEFGPAQFLREARARHAALALDGDRLLLAGGCARLEGTACAPGSELATSVVLTVSTGELSDGPRLERLRIDGAALAEPDGRVLLFGGTDGAAAPVTVAERIDPGGGPGELIEGTGAAGALLAAGGVLTGFAPAGAAASSNAAVIPPGATTARAVDGIEARAGAVIAPLEGGRALVIGGADGDGSQAAVFVPARGGLEPLAAGQVAPRRGGAAVPLDDGSVLLIGGLGAGGAAAADAWIFRPDLVGPWSAGRSATFATPEASAAMVPRDPGRASVVPAAGSAPAHYRIESSGGGQAPSEWAVMAGPRFRTVSLEANLSVEGGGAALLLWFRDPAHAAFVALVPGQPAALIALEAGRAAPLGECAGEAIAEADLAPGDGAGHALTVTASAAPGAGGELVAALDGRPVLRCQVEPPGAGLVGAAPLGEGAVLRLDLISASR